MIVRTLALIVLVLGAPALSSAKPDPEAVELLEELVKAGRSLDSIWPGFDPGQRPLGIYRENRDLVLISSQPPAEPFVPVEEGRLRGRGWHTTEVTDRLRGVFAIGARMGGLEFTAIRSGGDLGLLIHEDFHLFQRRQWSSEEQVSLAGFDAQDSAHLRVLLELEDAALIRVWQASEKGRRREHLLDYLALRTTREAGMPADLVAAERLLERREGSARYVDQEVLARLGRETVFRHADHLRAILGQFRGGPIQTAIRARVYVAGDTIGVNLDELMDEQEWKKRMNQHQVDFPDLLAEALEADPGQLERRVAEMKASGRFERRVRRMERRMGSGRTSFDFSNYHWQLVFQFVHDPAEEDLRASFTTAGSIRHLDDDWMLVPDPSEYTLAGGNQTLRIEGHPVLSRTRQADPGKVREVIVLLNKPPETPDGPIAPGEYQLDGSPFRETGIEFEARQAVPVSLYPFD